MAGAMRLSGRCYPEASAKAPWSLSHLTSFPAGPERTTPRSAPCSAPAPGRSRSLSSRLVSRQQGVQLPCVPATFVLSGCPIPSYRESSSAPLPVAVAALTTNQIGTRRHGSSRACVCVQSHLQILGVSLKNLRRKK